MNKLIPFILSSALLLICTAAMSSSIFEDFRVTTEDAELYTYTESSIKLESKSPSYMVRLEPNIEGAVMFSLGSHGYTSTVKVPGIVFGVVIEAYKNGRMITPIFNLDEANEGVVIEDNFVKFHRINGAIPVYFNTTVDSIRLNFFNSYAIDVHQYLSIDDLKVVKPGKISENPFLVDCDQHSIMIGLDGSASIDKKERKTVAKQLMRFFKRPPESLDSNEVCIMEFGKEVKAVSESIEQKEIVKNLKEYKKSKSPKKQAGYTNWAAAFDRAIERKPDVFIFITDRWSNYSNSGPTSFSAQYETLIAKCNKLKANGTRLLFITSGLNIDGGANPALYAMLNQSQTNEVIGVDLTANIDLKEVDLISMDGFETFERIDLSSLLECGGGEVATSQITDSNP